jgi:beta-phosphoglucomutase
MNVAVIFDVDGVLVDSYAAHFESWRQLAAGMGATLTEDDFAASFGRRSADIIRQWPGAAAVSPARATELDALKEAHYRQIAATRLPPMDGAVELIDSLRAAGIRLAVGSSAPPENIELALDRLGRRHAFDAMVTGRDVTRGKPDPQVFLMAASRLGIEPRRCVVIEDAPAGIEAAHAGGMAAVALLSTGRAPADFSAIAPERLVGSLREVSTQLIMDLVDRPVAPGPPVAP